MARTLYRLTVAEVKAATGRAPLQDGGGLLYDPGSARWTLRYTSPTTKRRRDMALGPLTLKAARERADEHRRQVAQGFDPLAVRDANANAGRAAIADAEALAARAQTTLESYAVDYHSSIVGGFRNAKHGKQWLASLKNHVFPTLGKKPIADITAGDLLDLLLPLQQDVPETAHRARLRLAAIFDDAVLRGKASANPAAVIKRRMRDAVKRSRDAHHMSLPYAQVPAFAAAVRGAAGRSVVARLALEFTLLTAARTGETTGATFDEFDLEARVWTIPGERMKAKKPHRVPLVDRVVAIVKQCREATDGPWLFPSPNKRKQPLSDMAMLVLLRRLHVDAALATSPTYSTLTTVHGLRASFSSWGREQTKFRTDVIEAALAHREQDRVAAAYAHAADYWTERIELAKEWGRFVST